MIYLSYFVVFISLPSVIVMSIVEVIQDEMSKESNDGNKIDITGVIHV